jgi:hypothetical protein
MPRRWRPSAATGTPTQALEASSLVVTVTLRTGRALTQLGRHGRERRKLTVRRSRLSREAPGARASLDNKRGSSSGFFSSGAKQPLGEGEGRGRRRRMLETAPVGSPHPPQKI